MAERKTQLGMYHSSCLEQIKHHEEIVLRDFLGDIKNDNPEHKAKSEKQNLTRSHLIWHLQSIYLGGKYRRGKDQ